MTYTSSSTETYSVLDIETVFTSFKAELCMIASSSGALTTSKAEEYGYDAEYLAKKGYLKWADVTLLNQYGEEVRAVRYTVNTAAGELISSRVGGVLWPKSPDGVVRVILSYTAEWDCLSADGRSRISNALKGNWVPSYTNTSHSTLTSSGGRAFISNNYGIQRQDYSK